MRGYTDDWTQKRNIKMATKSEKFMWGFERLSWAFKSWVRLLNGTAGRETFYNYLESPSSDK